MLKDTEILLLHAAALAIIAGILLAVADTPLYPVAIGMEVVALLYFLLDSGATLNPNAFLDWLRHPAASVGG